MSHTPKQRKSFGVPASNFRMGYSPALGPASGRRPSWWLAVVPDVATTFSVPDGRRSPLEEIAIGRDNQELDDSRLVGVQVKAPWDPLELTQHYFYLCRIFSESSAAKRLLLFCKKELRPGGSHNRRPLIVYGLMCTVGNVRDLCLLLF